MSNNMHVSAANSLCSLCASPLDRSALVDINGNAGKQLNLKEMLTQYIPVTILQGIYSDPDLICNPCVRNLQVWHKFISNCTEAQNKLKEEWKETEKQTDRKKQHTTSGAVLPKPLLISPRSSPTKPKKSCNYCVARWCNIGNYRGVSLFRFPKERDRAMVWLTAADRLDLKDIKALNNYYLCAKHFSPNMFTNQACNQLIKKAVPSIFPKPHFTHKKSAKEVASQLMPTRLMGKPLKTILPKDADSQHWMIAGKTEQAESKDTRSQFASFLPNTSKCELMSPTKDRSSDLSDTSYILKVIPRCVSSDIKPETKPIESCSSKTETKEVLCTSKSVSSTGTVSSVSASNNPVGARTECLRSVESVWQKNAETRQVSTIPRPNCGNPDTKSLQGASGSEETGKRTGHIQEPSLPNPSFYSSGKSGVFEEGCDYFSNGEIYSSNAGSQDLLLTHLIDKGKPASSFQVQSLALHCDLSQDAAQGSERGPNQSSELSSATGLFDLQADDVRDSAAYIQQMENLEELMDLDNFFESR